MTLPYERYRAVTATRAFLASLLTPRDRRAKVLRAEAYRLLKHFPTDTDLIRIANKCPELMEVGR